MHVIGPTLCHGTPRTPQVMACAYDHACAVGGNTVIPDHTLQKAAIEQYLDGGLTLQAITYQVCVCAQRGG